ncbi:MAG TPA: hypothetical protein VFD73_25320 [Gemmatimonadales bacterium]|nr:hypothetical protein [Gemmatimonadales bacterium]
MTRAASERASQEPDLHSVQPWPDREPGHPITSEESSRVQLRSCGMIGGGQRVAYLDGNVSERTQAGVMA